MTILLTVPHRELGEVKIISMAVEPSRSAWYIIFEYGDTVSGDWVAGDVQWDERRIRNIAAEMDGIIEITPPDPRFDDFLASATPPVTFTDMTGDPKWIKVPKDHPIHGSLDIWVMLTYDSVLTNLYQYALDKGWFAGTIQ